MRAALAKEVRHALYSPVDPPVVQHRSLGGIPFDFRVQEFPTELALTSEEGLVGHAQLLHVLLRHRPPSIPR